MFNWLKAEKPIVALAPMADMTDSAFCRVVRKINGTGPVIFREMVSAEALVRGNRKTLEMCRFDPAERPIVQQIFGGDPAVMAEAVRIVDGAFSPDAFDVNMGCPVHKLTCNFNGASLMRDPDKAAAIVRAMKAATARPVSVKTRLGWSRPDEVLAFAPVLAAAGADLITVHGRTREQGYAGRADWAMIGRVKKAVGVPVLGNGDIDSGAAAGRALEISGCDGVMIGRGALGRPWIFREVAAAFRGETCPPPDAAELAAIVREHARLHAAAHDADAPLVTFRKHLAWYFRGLPGAKAVRERMVRVSTLADLDALLDEFLAGAGGRGT